MRKIHYATLLSVLLVTVSLSALTSVPEETSAYTLHEPIYINGNGDFIPDNGVTGGSGSMSDPYILKGWEISSTSEDGIEIRNTDAYFVITDVVVHTLQGYRQGILLRNVMNGCVQRAELSENERSVDVQHSAHVTIKGNMVSASGDGIYVYLSSEITIAENSVSDTIDGISIDMSSTVKILDNILTDNRFGVTLTDTEFATMSGNVMVNNGFRIIGDFLNQWNTHFVDTSNKVGGKPVYYWRDTVGGTIPPDAGQVVLANCTDATIQNLDFEGLGTGVQLGFSREVTIASNRFSDNMLSGIVLGRSDHNLIANNNVSGTRGIALGHSHHNVIAHNIGLENHWSIDLWTSSDNMVSNNDFSYSVTGIKIRHSSEDNAVSNNTLSHNGRGISLSDNSNNNTITHNNFLYNGWSVTSDLCDDNMIHHNNILSNRSMHVWDDRATNEWDDGYPSGGNFWSDYEGVDNFSGPNQDQPGGDGLGDTPYDIFHISGKENEDHYPLMSSFTPPPSPPSSPRKLLAFGGNQQVALTWNTPLFDGGSPITNYVVFRGTAPDAETPLDEIGNVLNYTDSGLMNGQTYFYKVRAKNAAGEGAESNGVSATPDLTSSNQPPVCAITDPTAGSTTLGLSVITGTATDSDGTVQTVEVRIDDGVWVLANGASSWGYFWDTTDVSNGNHTIFARSFDGESYSGETSIHLMVDNPPPTSQPDEYILAQAWFWAVIASVIILIVLALLLVKRSLRGWSRDRNAENRKRS